MKKILLTGADGFIGSYVLERLNEVNNIDYLCVCIKGTDKIEKDKQVVADILDSELLEKIVLEYKPDVILHMAAIANVVVSNLPLLYEINVIGTENLLKAASKLNNKELRFILMSSAGVYGNQEPMFYDEQLPFNPANHYSYTKMVDEFICKQYEDEMDIKIVRPFTVIGKNQTQGFFVAKLVEAFKNRAPKIEVGNIKSVRDYVDVKYCAAILCELMIRDKIENSVLNICGGRQITGDDVIKELEEITGYKPEIIISDKFVRKNEVWHLVGDPTEVDKFMENIEKQRSFREMLIEMLSD